MRGTARRYDFDLVLAADFRGCGEAAETLASHLASLADTGLRLGLLWLRDPDLPPAAPVHPRLAQLVREHTAVPIPPETDELACRLALIYEPRLLALAVPPSPKLRADQALVILAQPPHRQGSQAFDPGRAAAMIEARLARRQLWCPASPAIRRQWREHAAGLPLSLTDLPPLEPVAAWRTAAGFAASSPARARAHAPPRRRPAAVDPREPAGGLSGRA